MSDIFLSYSHADQEFARRLRSSIVEAGVRVWFDEGEMKVGDSLIAKIEAAISEMTYLGVVLSPRSVASPWVQREVRAALTEEIQNECVKVLPLLIENCEIPGFLRDKLYADFRGNYQRGLSELLHRLKPLDYLPASYNRESLELYLSEEALKAGLEQKILHRVEDVVEFSPFFLGNLSDVAKRVWINNDAAWFMEDRHVWRLFVLAIVKTRDEGVTADELWHMYQELEASLYDYLLNFATQYGVLSEVNGAFQIADSFRTALGRQMERWGLSDEPFEGTATVIKACIDTAMIVGKGTEHDVYLAGFIAYFVYIGQDPQRKHELLDRIDTMLVH